MTEDSSRLHEILDADEDGEPYSFFDVVALATDLALARGGRLEIIDDPDNPDEPLYQIVDADGGVMCLPISAAGFHRATGR